MLEPSAYSLHNRDTCGPVELRNWKPCRDKVNSTLTAERSIKPVSLRSHSDSGLEVFHDACALGGFAALLYPALSQRNLEHHVLVAELACEALKSSTQGCEINPACGPSQ